MYPLHSYNSNGKLITPFILLVAPTCYSPLSFYVPCFSLSVIVRLSIILNDFGSTAYNVVPHDDFVYAISIFTRDLRSPRELVASIMTIGQEIPLVPGEAGRSDGGEPLQQMYPWKLSYPLTVYDFTRRKILHSSNPTSSAPFQPQYLSPPVSPSSQPTSL